MQLSPQSLILHAVAFENKSQEGKWSTVGYLALWHKSPQDRGNDLASKLSWNPRGKNIERTKPSLVPQWIFPPCFLKEREPGVVVHFHTSQPPHLKSSCPHTITTFSLKDASERSDTIFDPPPFCIPQPGCKGWVLGCRTHKLMAAQIAVEASRSSWPLETSSQLILRAVLKRS